MLPWGVKGALARIGADSLRPGDVVMHNDPFIGGTHTPDIIMFAPVFHGGRVVALVDNLAHHVDMGGKVSGSLAPDADEIFQEGIRFPPVRLQKEGRLDPEILATAGLRDRSRHDVSRPRGGVHHPDRSRRYAALGTCRRTAGARFALARGGPSGPDERTPLGSKARVRLHNGDRLFIETSGGGGWGPPLERDPAAVAADAAEGLITRERARAAYGVIIGPDGEADEGATRQERRNRSGHGVDQ